MPSRSSAISNSPEKKIRIARIEDIKRTFHTVPNTTFREYYRRGSVGQKNSQREALVESAAAVKNCAGRLLSFFVALCRQGFDATLSPLDVISERLKLSTGGLGEPRTIRRELQTLEKLGWIHRSHVKTNTQIMTSKGLLTLQVLQITFAANLYAMLDFEAPLYDVDLLRPKRTLRPRIEPRQKQTFGRSAFADGVTSDGKKECLRLATAAPVAQTSIRVQLATAAPVAQTSILEIAEDSQDKKQQIPCLAPVAEVSREEPHERKKSEKLGSYSDFRAIFIKTVEAHFFSSDGKNAQRLTQIAANQTMLCYPAAFPRIDFDLIAWSLSEWHKQRELIRNYCEKIKIFAETEVQKTETVKKIFLKNENPVKTSYEDSIACIMVSGRLKLRELNQSMVERWRLFVE